MKLSRCPVCHSHITLEALVQDDAARELIALLAGAEAELGRALVQYLGLFRAPSRDLSNDRALRLCREVLALHPHGASLAHALRETVNALRSKGSIKPLSNHNYLGKVLDSVCSAPVSVEPGRGKTSKQISSRRTLISDELTDRSWAE